MRPADPGPTPVDQVGAATLERMAAAPRYNRWMFDRLRPWVGRRVRLVLLVPALRALYGTLDKALDHFRRYVPKDVVGKLQETGFHVRHVEYFNLGGVLGWWLAGRVLRRSLISIAALRWYEALVPLFRL